MRASAEQTGPRKRCDPFSTSPVGRSRRSSSARSPRDSQRATSRRTTRRISAATLRLPRSLHGCCRGALPAGGVPRRARPLSLTCAGPPRQAQGPGCRGELRLAGGSCARLVVRIVCARAPSLTSVHDPGWLRAGDMMCDGVIPLGEAVRPLGLSGPSTRWWRRESAGSRPRRIGVIKGCARTGKLMRAPAPPRRARAACGRSA
jgi:hypothetical protein